MILRRVLLSVLALVMVLPILAVVAVVLMFDGDALKSRAIEAVRRATGRELTIAGPVRLSWSLSPTVSAEGVLLANPPGMSRPMMATASRLEAQVALWPLLRRQVEVRGLTLDGADVLLERDAEGRPNWVFARPAAPPADPAAIRGALAERLRVSVDLIQVHDGRLGWRSGARLDTLAIPTLQARTEAPGTVRLSGAAELDGLPVDVQGTTGSLAAADGAWPLDVRLSAGEAVLHADGAIGGAIALTAEVPDLAALSRLAGRPLPPLRDVHASAQLGPAGLSALTAQAVGEAGPLRLTRLTLTAPSQDQPVSLVAEGQSSGVPVTMNANAASMASLLRPGPTPVKVQMQAAGATLAGDGTANLRDGILDGQVSVGIPDLQALGAAAGARLPALHDVSFDGRMSIATAPGTFALRGVRLAVPGADAAGDLDIATSPRIAVRGTLASQRLDLDALAAALTPDQPVPPAPAAPNPVAPNPAAPLPAASAHLLSDTPLPFEALRRGDADLHLSANEAVWRGVPFHAVSARLLLQEGRLRLDPVTAAVPGGAASGHMEADAGVPSAGIAVQANGLAAGPLLSALLKQEAAGGTLDLDVALSGQGASLRGLAATLDGHAGVALVDGTFDLGGIAAALGDALPKGLPAIPAGRSTVRCLALRLDATTGKVLLHPLLLDSSRLHLAGDGTLNLADETLDLQLRPQIRLALGGVSVPVRVSGTFRAPRTQADIAGGAGRSGLLIGAPPPPDDCAQRLVEARGGRDGPVPAAAPEAPRPKAADLFRNLLR